MSNLFRRAGVTVNRPRNRVDRWLFQPGDARRLAAIRIGLYATLLARLSRGVYLSWAHQPQGVYRPLSFIHLFPSVPTPPTVLAIQSVGITACVFAIVGLWTRPSMLIAWACATFLIGMVASFGRDGQNEALLLLALIPLLAARTGDAWSVDERLRRSKHVPELGRSAVYGWPVRTEMVLVAGGYFFAGFAKLLWSGPAWIFSSNLRWILYTASDSQRSPNDLGLLLANRPWLVHVVAAGALITELLFPLILWRPTLAWLFVPGAVILHVAIWATIGLNYSAWAATTVVVFVDGSGLAERAKLLSTRAREAFMGRRGPEPWGGWRRARS